MGQRSRSGTTETIRSRLWETAPSSQGAMHHLKGVNVSGHSFKARFGLINEGIAGPSSASFSPQLHP